MQITNCFRIGYRDFGEGMRAVKRNGEILAGSYMVGAKWAVSDSVAVFWLTHGLIFLTPRTKDVPMRSLLKQLVAGWCQTRQSNRHRRTRWLLTRFIPFIRSSAHRRMGLPLDWHRLLLLFESQASLQRKDSKGRWRHGVRHLLLGYRARHLLGSHRGRACWARYQI
jgi:hypothetical protein